MKKKPNPGSEEAIALGCECPVIDNGYGTGSYKSEGFIYSVGCPVHTDEMTHIIR